MVISRLYENSTSLFILLLYTWSIAKATRALACSKLASNPNIIGLLGSTSPSTNTEAIDSILRPLCIKLTSPGARANGNSGSNGRLDAIFTWVYSYSIIHNLQSTDPVRMVVSRLYESPDANTNTGYNARVDKSERQQSTVYNSPDRHEDPFWMMVVSRLYENSTKLCQECWRRI
jgi:hypothetical protein